MKRRAVIFVQEYPQLSETYIKNEIDQLWEHYDIQVVSLKAADYPYLSSRPHIMLTQENQHNVIAALKNFAPHIVHGHYLYQAKLIRDIANAVKAPFTIRAHSFDILSDPLQNLHTLSSIINTDECLGVLAFPFTRSLLEATGIKPNKLIDCYPVVNYRQFYDTSPNGKAIMNVGAALPKKKMEDYIALSRLLPERMFNLYAMGYNSRLLVEANTKMGGRVNFIGAVEPEAMLPEYKRHEWLVYTASNTLKSVGWPMAVAEAQASGVGVCVQNVRADIREFLGDAGFVFDTPEDAADIIKWSVPEDMRQRGFEQAKRSDIAEHIKLLTNLWQ
jgi:glycosyltransferase involved in cell wall biosynthesis